MAWLPEGREMTRFSLRAVTAALFVLLTITLATGWWLPVPAPQVTADEDRAVWAETYAEAHRRGATEVKPVAVFLLSDSAASKRFRGAVERDRRLQKQLAEFVPVEVRPKDHADLVRRFRMERFPVVLFQMPGGRPIKLMVGVTSTPKVRGECKEVLTKFQRALNPANWFSKRQRSPDPRAAERRLVHPSSCPTRCSHCEPALDRALAYLTELQRSDGSWTKLDDEKETTADRGRVLTRSIDHIDSALTAVAGLALLTTGSTPGEGPHGGRLARARNYLSRAIRADGAITAAGDDFVYHVHGIFETSLAALFLAECHAVQPSRELAQKLGLVADALAAAQDERTGGWGYSFDAKTRSPASKEGWRLLATTHCALSALNALADAGIPVDEEARKRGVRYLQSCIAQDGHFGYRTELRRMPGHAGATAGALFAIDRSGVRVGDLALQRRRLRDDLHALEGFGEHWWFFVLYTALHSNDRGEGSWRAFHHLYRDRILANQDEDGSFADPDEKAGRIFATSIAAIGLGLGRHPPKVCGRRSGEREIERTKVPKYRKPPNPLSRVKAFERDGLLLADLVVSVDAPASRAYLEQLADGLRGASRILFDVTDGQLALHHIRILAEGAESETADLLVTKDFYSDPNVPAGRPHGITMVSVRNEVRGGREIEGVRIGEWVKLPYALPRGGSPIPWHHVGLTRVLAHELGHYLLGIQDEYGVHGSYCACLVGDPHTTELCRDDDHTDDRRSRSCWTQARRVYPSLRIPTDLDPGPWDPPLPVVEFE